MTIDERNVEVNKALETRFSQLNAALEEHEAKLKAMMVPLPATVKYRSYAAEDPKGQIFGEHQYFIGMTKLNGSWRLCHAYCFEYYGGGPEEEFKWKPIVEASIEDRISAAEHLDQLREEIIRVKEKLIPDVEKAIETLAKSFD